MGFFGKLALLALDVIETPVAIIKDAATLGGSLTDQDKPYTAQKLSDIQDDYDLLKDDLKD